MNQVSSIVQFDKKLRQFTVDFVEDGENETAIFSTASEADAFVKTLWADGYTTLRVY